MTAAGMVCAACSTELPPNSKFCNECGAAVAVVAEPAEFKQVTVLFADVVRSMDIAASVGAERLREMMTELVERCASVVQRYGGTMEQFTGDGLMAVFGAPVALEDHAVRACLAALGIQSDARHLGEEIQRRDGIALQLRVGLNSGQVTAGATGPGVLGYTLIGEQVGLAQRMESVAPPGAVMVSESTARLVEHAAVLESTELVRIKGADKPVPARRLLAMGPRQSLAEGTESSLVGRQAEVDAVEAMVDRSGGGRGGVLGVVGPPGVGKSRVAREAAALAASRGIAVYWAFCESHAGDVPFQLVRHLLRAACGIAELDGPAARDRVRMQFAGSDDQDLRLLDDLLGIADSAPQPAIDPDARRRRLTAMINAASLARNEPVLYVIEDAHWIDEVSESMLVDFLAVIPHTPSLLLITYRPDYRGALTRLPGAQTLMLAPLSNSDTAALIAELLGTDPSVGDLAATIAERAAGNPFFAEEMVRELVQRGVLDGDRGNYLCHTNTTEITVPATVQAVIEARIDRLNAGAKRTLNAASVIGSRFDAQLLAALGIEPAFDELLTAELIDQVSVASGPEYAFHHPLIRAVAYESQLRSERTEVHRRLAAAIESANPTSAEQNAALIAEHLDAAGDPHAAYGWHMRAGAWSANRDIAAARRSWERARRIADTLSDDNADLVATRIAPRTMLCVTRWRAAEANVSGGFDELRTLCEQAGDKASLAMGMTGSASAFMFHGRVREASRLVSEQMTLLVSIGDPTLIMGATYAASATKVITGALADVLEWSQAVVDMAGDDASANLAMVSPLATALEFRGVARFWLGRAGWRQDLDDAAEMASTTDPVTRALVLAGGYGFAIANGALVADDATVLEIEEALRAAEGLTGDTALSTSKCALGIALVTRDARADWERGLELLTQLRTTWLRERSRLYLVPVADLAAAWASAKLGNRDHAIRAMRKAVNHMFHTGSLGTTVVGTRVLVETLMERGADGDMAEARSAVDRLASAPLGESVVRDIVLLRLRALLARADGHEADYRDLRNRYRHMAKSLGFEGHMAMAEAMS
ncbi:adenylate/guanylate cyclase domain-containing protein [Mycolicibacterium lutetiense]